MWDAEEYHQMALSISKGAVPEFIAYRPPLYPLLLGIIYMVFGAGALIPRLFQILLGVVSCVLVQRIGTRLFDPMSGFFAGLAASLTGMMIYFDLELLPTSLFVFLTLLLVNEMLKVESGAGSALKSGLWFGLACLCRPTLLPFFPVAALWLSKGSNGRKNSGIFAAIVLIVMTLSTISHTLIKNGPVVVSAQGGVNFLIGNNAGSDGMTASLPGYGSGWSWDTIESWAEAYRGQKLNPYEVDKVFWKIGFSDIQSDLGGFFSRIIRKAGLFWNRYEISSNRDLYYHARSFPMIGVLMKFGFVLFLPFALTSFVVGYKSRNIRLICYLIFVYYISILPFFVNARFRHPLTPFLIILAVGSIGYWIKQIKAREFSKKHFLPTLAFLIGVVLPFSANSHIDPERWDYGLFTEGKVLERSGRLTEAEQNYLQALEHNPHAPYVNYHLAELMRNKGNLRNAVKYYQRELEIQPQFSKGWNDLGVIFVDSGDQEEALRCFEKAISIQPGLSEAGRNAARIYGYKGIAAAERADWGETLADAKRASDLDPTDPVYHVLLLEAKFFIKDTLGISSELELILNKYPSLTPALELKALLNLSELSE